jgi:ADP-ribose pyrophosphatase YjhB (NUDIX family)
MPRLDGWRFCPRCAAALTHAPGRVECAGCGFVSWANSAATANAFLEDERGRLLLARRAREPFQGFWDIPGGFVEEDEHPLAALVRELKEETGLDVSPGAYVGCWLDTYGDPGDGVIHTLNLFWRAHTMPGQAGNPAPAPVAADDVAELRWFARDELPPPEELAFRCVLLALEAWKALSPG